MYQPNANALYSPSNGIDFWALALQITGIASLTGAINLIVTVLNMRAPGMKLMRMPIFTWMILVVKFLLVFAIPVITVALFLLTFQRQFGATFFMITGFHGTHVTIGVIFLVIIARKVLRGDFDTGRRGTFTSRRGGYENVEVMGLYWHFVDLVWVFIFAFFYLW